MSIKSLLQVILFLLIIIIIGGIYFLYFYSGPIKNKEVVVNELDLQNSENKKELTATQEILEGINTKQNKEIEKVADISKQNFNNNKIPIKEKKNKEISNNESTNKNLENFTKNIEYVTTNKNGDVFKIIAEHGKTNLQDSNILDLVNVDGSIISVNRSDIYISSIYAEYNYSNRNSKFYKNVKINYDNKIIKCDNLDLNFTDNIAVGYNNVTVEDNNSFMKANKITMNMLTKDISINSDDKIEITTN